VLLSALNDCSVLFSVAHFAYRSGKAAGVAAAAACRVALCLHLVKDSFI
jgi:hypothetical protein